MKQHRGRVARTQTVVASAIAGLTFGLAVGCSSSGSTPADSGVVADGGGMPPGDAGGPPMDGGGTMGSGNVTASQAVASTGAMFWTPFDSVPSPDGTKIYFVAQGKDPASAINFPPGVYSVAANGGTVALIKQGDPLKTPIGIQISSDGATLYIVDSGADDGMDHQGRLFSMSSSGGMLSPIGGTDGTLPKGIEVVKENGSDQIYFSGRDPADGAPALMKIQANGGPLTIVKKGAPLKEPGGIAVTRSGTIYLADSASSARRNGQVFKIEGAMMTILADDIRTAFPASIALAQDESGLLVSGFNPETQSSILYRYDLARMTRSTFNAGIEGTTEPAGLHRAHDRDVYSWANADGCRSCPAGRGAVYLVR